MSLQSARDFVTKVADDEEFRKGLNGCKTKEEQRKFAEAAGFMFTRDELWAARNEIQDADLDRVSGGGCCACESDVCTNATDVP